MFCEQDTYILCLAREKFRPSLICLVLLFDGLVLSTLVIYGRFVVGLGDPLQEGFINSTIDQF